MQNNKYTKLISLSLGVMIFSFIIGTALFAWREPAQTPPAGNVPAPINIGTIEQHKAGEIGAHRFEDSQNTSWFIDPNQPISAAFSGNVGIGTTAPGQRLQVLDGNILVGNIGGTGGTLLFGNPSHGIRRGTPGVNFIDIFTAGGTESGFAFTHAGGELMRITNIGNVGIGTTAPWGRLHIRVATGSAGIVLESAGVGPGHHGEIIFRDPGTAGFVIMQDSHNADNFSIARSISPWTRFLSINNTGNVGIGTATPHTRLDVAGAIRPGIQIVCDTNTVGAIRFDANTLRFEGCNGTYWVSIASIPTYFLYDTAITFTGNLGPRNVADGRCMVDADRPAVCTRGAWAFVSFSVDDEIRDLPVTKGINMNSPWIFRDGTSVGTRAADNFFDLLDGSVDHTPSSGGLDLAYWTGSTYAGAWADNCARFMSSSHYDFGRGGLPGSTAGRWLDDTIYRCTWGRSLLCACY